MNSYDYLTGLCQAKSPSSFSLRGKPSSGMTNKVKYIVSEIQKIKKDYPESDVKGYIYDFANNRQNIVIFFPAPCQIEVKTIGFMAHHDIVNPSSDNVFDNQASVAHLLSLARECAALEPLYHNILIAFTDGEEVGGLGARHLASLINSESKPFGDVATVINLELTAAGSHFWTDDSGALGNLLFKKATQTYTNSTHLTIGCPFNDSIPLRHAQIDSGCVGTITRSEVQRIKKGKLSMPKIWNICHDKKDNLHLANKDDMLAFSNLLFCIAQKDWDNEINSYEYRAPVKRILKTIKPIWTGQAKKKKNHNPHMDEGYQNWWEDVDAPY